MPGWQTYSTNVNPNAEDSKPLWLRHVPFEVVTDHPGIRGCNGHFVERLLIHTGIRFAESELTLDQNQIEQIC